MNLGVIYIFSPLHHLNEKYRSILFVVKVLLLFSDGKTEIGRQEIYRISLTAIPFFAPGFFFMET